MKNWKSFAFAALFLLAPLGSEAIAIDGAHAYKASAAILSAGSRAAAVKHIDEVPSVGVVRLDAGSSPRLRRGGVGYGEFKISAEKNAAGISRLRSALSRNPATREALADYGIAIRRVVGIDIYSNGSIRVYVIR